MIKVEQIYKNIKDKTVLEDISFEIASGECVALIGPNGAGKTTLMDCLLGEKFVTKGNIALDGKSPLDKALKEVVAILPQENAVVQRLTVAELIHFFRAIYPEPLTEEEVDQLLRFSPEQKKQLAEKLSGGQKRLMSFVLTLIGRPKILFLDEPTAAMDTSTRQRFWEIIADLKKQGVTILYSSHYIEEVEHTADRILVLHEGKLIRDTTPFAMRSEEVDKHFTVPVAYLSILEGLAEVSDLTIKQDNIEFVTRDAKKVWEILSQAGCSIEAIELKNRSLLASLFETTKEEEA